jgi:hypothetical protein
MLDSLVGLVKGNSGPKMEILGFLASQRPYPARIRRIRPPSWLAPSLGDAMRSPLHAGDVGDAAARRVAVHMAGGEI